MELSRRAFLACAAGVMSTRPRRGAPIVVESSRTWVVLPLRGRCSLPESTLGYRSALAGAPERPDHAPLLIIPAVLDVPGDIARLIRLRLTSGATVIVESGAGFAGQVGYREHHRSLREGLNIDTHAPVDLWAAGRSRHAPYVDYSWPEAVRVRDFSRVVPLKGRESEVIARADGLPVALRRAVGAGTLIFLGSPLGPALWAGDREARRWLFDVAARAS
jgi:hypothetical protein